MGYGFVPQIEDGASFVDLLLPLPASAPLKERRESMMSRLHATSPVRFYGNATIPAATIRFFRIYCADSEKYVRMVDARDAEATSSDSFERRVVTEMKAVLEGFLHESDTVISRDAVSLPPSMRKLVALTQAQRAIILDNIEELEEYETFD